MTKEEKKAVFIEYAEKVVSGELSRMQASRESGIPQSTFYEWFNAYSQGESFAVRKPRRDCAGGPCPSLGYTPDIKDCLNCSYSRCYFDREVHKHA